MERPGMSSSGQLPAPNIKRTSESRIGLLADRSRGSRRRTRSRRVKSRYPGAPCRLDCTNRLVIAPVCAILETHPNISKRGWRRGAPLRPSVPTLFHRKSCSLRHLLGVVSTQTRVPRHGGARLTFGLHFPYRRLILCVATDASASTIGGRLRDWQLALSLRGVRIRH